MELYEHQKKLISQNPARHLLAHGMGSGKTRTSIELVKKRGGSCLIICPKMLKENWARETEKWGLTNEKLIISKEEFKLKFMKAPRRYANIIVDEAHYFGHYTSKLSKSLALYIEKYRPDSVYLLTGSPYLSTPWNIFTLVNYLGAGLRYGTFRRQCFHDIRMGGRVVPVPRLGIEPYLNGLIKAYGSIVVLEDCFDVPEQTFDTVYFSLTKEQEKAKKELNASIFEHIVRFTKQHTLENGLILSDGYDEDRFFPSEKLEYIKEIAKTEKKLAIAVRYTKQMELYTEELRNAGYEVYNIAGGVPNRQAIIDEVNNSEEAIIIINASCSEGYELPTISKIIFASLSFSYKDYQQFCGRFLRANALKKNFYTHLVVKGGVDEEVFKCIQNKKDFTFKLLTNK